MLQTPSRVRPGNYSGLIPLTEPYVRALYTAPVHHYPLFVGGKLSDYRFIHLEQTHLLKPSVGHGPSAHADRRGYAMMPS